MSVKEAPVLERVEDYCKSILKSLPETMTFHNLEHTQNVVDAAEKISDYEEVSDDQKEITLIAAWFHDLGFSESYNNHETHSCRLAEDLLSELNYSEDAIQKVKSCIIATHKGYKPETTCEKVLCDADMAHLSESNYFKQYKKLKAEWEHYLNKNYTEDEWLQENLKFLTSHDYFTNYGKNVLQDGKLKNIGKQEKKIKKFEKKLNATLSNELNIDPTELKELKKKLKKVEGRPDRGIETMFRVTSRNHIDLSAMADNKANILISVNAIIISILIGFLTSKLDSNPHLIFPTFFLITISVVTIVFSILATRPNVTKGTFTKEDIKNRKANLLFFGNFHQMSRDDYKIGMFETMSNADYLYSSLIDDIYFNGRVLGKKYKYLRVAYNIFMFGLIIAVLAFLAVNYTFIQSLN